MHNDPHLTERRKELRNNATPQEIILWKYLRGRRLGYKFRRQHSIDFYIVDFCCPEKKIIIEIDGSQHLRNKEYDAGRTRYLKELGYIVLRFWNYEINKNIESVINTIKKTAETHRVTETTPSLRDTPTFQGGEVRPRS
jgi:very-short-patch-repair endonuclease